MCGIAGLLTASSAEQSAALLARVEAMGRCLAHRGPDSGDAWIDAAGGIALAHRRLAIVDLSPTGHQPMVSADGRFVVSYNGEIYNAAELRAELEAAGAGPFRGHSDTEVLVQGCSFWGVEGTARRLIGMFAFAAWDRRERQLSLVRDRLGIKPLYWGKFGSVLLFGSELKALRAAGGWAPELDRESVTAYLRLAYVLAPRTIYKSVYKLLPGHILTVAPGGEPRIAAFWSLAQVVAKGKQEPLNDLSDSEAIAHLEELLSDAVRRRLVADVPVGAFLSGGVDSSTVAALMQRVSDRPVHTFTIGFENAAYDEAPYARAVAEHLGTDHTEVYVSSERARSIIPELPRYYDEPFADVSQIPTMLVSGVAREKVAVALSGDGGDELFAGYTRYAFASRLWSRLSWMPRPVRSRLAEALQAVPPGALQALFACLPTSIRPFAAGDRLHKLARVLDLPDVDALYRALVSQWQNPAALTSVNEPPGPLDDPVAVGAPVDRVERMQFLDMLTYLPDDVLTKVDRASMAVGLEARVPILDHRVVELAWRLPARFKLRNGNGKWLLRQVLYRHVPKSLIERPKQGFAVPLEDWLRGPLREWAEDLLDPALLAADGLIDPGPVRMAWTEHLSGRRNNQYRLWVVLMLQAWRREAGL
ncbi:asparagine synthase (glutamine-hydrolyzing) [Caenispirillum bisanense]|uniref:asparagine synthase (glutamine-hydrolyzing) n=1 Tax=Caenispirillum bisanense TaxID=414052 RepID=UPI0031DAB0F7